MLLTFPDNMREPRLNVNNEAEDSLQQRGANDPGLLPGQPRLALELLLEAMGYTSSAQYFQHTFITEAGPAHGWMLQTGRGLEGLHIPV